MGYFAKMTDKTFTFWSVWHAIGVWTWYISPFSVLCMFSFISSIKKALALLHWLHVWHEFCKLCIQQSKVLDERDYGSRLKFLLEEKIISVLPSTVESGRKSSSFCGEFLDPHPALSSISPLADASISGRTATRGLAPKLFVFSHAGFYVWMCDLS